MAHTRGCCDLLAQTQKTLAPNGKKVIFRLSFPQIVRPYVSVGLGARRKQS